MSGAIAVLGLLAAAVPEGKIVSIEVQAQRGRQALILRTSGDLGGVSVRREGNAVIVAVGLAETAGLTLPNVTPPLEELRWDTVGEGLALRVTVPAEVPYEIQREANQLAILFGEESQLPQPRPPRAESRPQEDIAELYRRILPVAPTEPEAGPLAATGPLAPESERRGLLLGPATFRPAATGLYMNAESALLESPRPVRDQYYEVRPSLQGDLPIRDGRLRADYEIRLRTGGSYPATRNPSHFANADLELPVGTFLVLHGFGHYAKGTMEAQEVDPGSEYFFDLVPYQHLVIGGGLRIRTGGRLDLDLSGTGNLVQLSKPSSFFDYRQQSARVGLGYDLTGSVRASLSYEYGRVPAPAERPEAKAEFQNVGFRLNGEILPLLTGEITVAYQDRRSPMAGPGGTHYGGPLAELSLTRELGRATRMILRGGRSTQVSAFEDNAYYIATWGDAELMVPLPFALTGRAAAGYHVNQYRTNASGLGEPRRDQIIGWAVGIGRSISRWGFARVDYRKDTRNSNLNRFDIDTHALTVQVGIGFYGEPRP